MQIAYMRRCLRESGEAAQGAPYVVTAARQLGSSGRRGRVCRHQTILRSFSGLLVLCVSCYAKEYCCDCGVADMSDQEEVVKEDAEGGVGGGSGEKEEGGGGAEGFPQEQDLPAE